MKRILKYKIDLKAATVIRLPHMAQILSCQELRGELMLWALVDENAETHDKIFEVFGTGQEIKYDIGVRRDYISTVQIGDFVLHIFEYNPFTF